MPISSEGRVLPAPSRADRNVPNASKGHCTAFVVLGDGAGTRMQAESRLELDHLKAQFDRRDVADIREQVLFRFGHRDEFTHVFDMVVTMTSGASPQDPHCAGAADDTSKTEKPKPRVPWRPRKQDGADQ